MAEHDEGDSQYDDDDYDKERPDLDKDDRYEGKENQSKKSLDLKAAAVFSLLSMPPSKWNSEEEQKISEFLEDPAHDGKLVGLKGGFKKRGSDWSDDEINSMLILLSISYFEAAFFSIIRKKQKKFTITDVENCFLKWILSNAPKNIIKKYDPSLGGILSPIIGSSENPGNLSLFSISYYHKFVGSTIVNADETERDIPDRADPMKIDIEDSQLFEILGNYLQDYENYIFYERAVEQNKYKQIVDSCRQLGYCNKNGKLFNEDNARQIFLRVKKKFLKIIDE